jgi:fused signal recognition particle receptor
VRAGVSRGADLVCVDTAGRLHTKSNLMEELKKVVRVMDKALPGAPHERLLVIDATVGQNGLAQARHFHDAIGVTGVAVTKLDGTAKGGIVVAIAQTLKLPIRLIGVGEGADDLLDFDAARFVNALLGEL